MSLYKPNIINLASNALDSDSSGLCDDVESSSEIFELLCELIEWLDEELARLQNIVRQVADDINFRVLLLQSIVSSYTPEQLQAEVTRLKGEALILLADVIEAVICDGVGGLKKIADSAFESAVLDRHKFQIAILTQIFTTPPKLILGSPRSIPKIIKAVQKAKQLSNIASALRVVAKVVRLLGRLVSIVGDIQSMVSSVQSAVDSLDALLDGRTAARPILLRAGCCSIQVGGY